MIDSRYEERVYVTYRCKRCGEECEYVHGLPEHMRIHFSTGYYRECGGELVEISRKKGPPNSLLDLPGFSRPYDKPRM